MKLQPRAKQPSEGRGRGDSAPAAGASAARGCERGPGQPPDWLAGVGVARLLLPAAGSWGRPWESGAFLGWLVPPRPCRQSDSRARGLGSGFREPQVWHRVSGIREPTAWGAEVPPSGIPQRPLGR